VKIQQKPAAAFMYMVILTGRLLIFTEEHSVKTEHNRAAVFMRNKVLI